MAELVDAIVANLSVKYEAYVAGFDKATAAHDRFKKSVPRIGAMGGFTQQEAQQYADRHTKIGEAAVASGEKRKRAAKGASDAEKTEAKAAADAVKRAAREKADAERAAAKASADAARAAEKEKQAVAKATAREQEKAAAAAKTKAEAERVAAAAAVAAAEREAAARVRLAEVAQRAVDRRRAGVTPGSGGVIGATVAREATGQSSIPASALVGEAAAEVVAEREINHALADQAQLQSTVSALKGKDRDAVRDQIAAIRLENQLRKAGLTDEEIALRLEERALVVERERAATARAKAKSSGAKGLEQFARGAGFGPATGGGAAVAGIATAIGVGVGVEVINSAVEYGKALGNLSKQLGITVEDLQAYEKLARDAGVETTTLSSAFGQFASNLGRAQQGGEEQAKVFKALGVNIKEFASAGDALPTIIDRISKIADPAQRAAIETRLFGEEGRKLDPLLSAGAEGVSALSRSLQETGRALSRREIQELDDTARKLADVKNQLQVDFAQIVAGNADAIERLAQSFGRLAEGTLQFLSSKPEQALAILGGLAGLRFAGPVGAIVGAAVGYQAGTLASAPAYSGGARIGKDGKITYVDANGQPTAAPGQSRPLYVRGPNGKQVLQGGGGKPLVLEGIDKTPPVQLGNVNFGLLSRLGAPKGPKGKSAESLAREAEQRERQYQDQLAASTADYLRAQEQLTGSADKRAAIEEQLAKSAYETRLKDIDSQKRRNVLAGADAGIEEARAAELKAAEKKAYLAGRSVIEQDKRFDTERALTAATASLLDARLTVLSAEMAMAKTAAERRRKQMEIIDVQAEQERNRLNGIIKSSPADSEEAKQASADLGRLPGQTGVAKTSARYDTRGPLERYREDIPRTADQINEALQNVEARGLQSLDDKLTDSISKVFKLGGAFGDVANGIISDLIRIGVQRAIIGPIADALFGAEGGGGGSAIASLLTKIGIGGHRASGGNVVAGVPYLVGEHGPEPVVFGQSGRVYPNGALPDIARAGGGGLTLHQSVTIDASGVNPEGFAERIVGIMRRETAQAIGINNGNIRKGFPAAQDRFAKLGTTG